MSYFSAAGMGMCPDRGIVAHPTTEVAPISVTDGREIQSRRIRSWGAVTATVTDFRAIGPFSIDLNTRAARISYIAECVGGEFTVRSIDTGVEVVTEAQGICYLPGGSPVIGYGRDLPYVRHLTIDFSLDELLPDDGLCTDFDALCRRRLGFKDSRLEQICRMFIDETLSGATGGRMFMDGLSTALLSRLVEIGDSGPIPQGGLAPWQLRRVTEHILTNLAEEISMEELAATVRLSRSYFCRTFKSTTGVTPHQWQLNARIEQAKEVILRHDSPLAQIALEVGFSDQAHFTRVFRKLEGVSPGQWRRSRRPAKPQPAPRITTT